MSRGQTPRTVDHWPRMKVRGGRRRDARPALRVLGQLVAYVRTATAAGPS